MPLHSHPLYETLQDIPEVVPEMLWLPQDSAVRIVKAPEHTETTTAPIEVGFAFFELYAGGFEAERQLIDIYMEEGKVPNDFLSNLWGNHLGRVILKAALDPDRLAPIDLVQAYFAESRFRGYNANEERFLAMFTEDWGVLRREG